MIRSLIEPLALPVIRYATRSYIAGESARDASDLAVLARQSGFSCTICYWNDGKEEPENVAAQYRSAISSIVEAGLDGSVSMKVPALNDRVDIGASIVRYARERNVRVMIDSHAPEQADDVFRTIDLCGPEGVGIAIPGRWKRSEADAERAISMGLDVRVVKGQWTDGADPDCDLREGFLHVSSVLAGRARHVGIATHDPALAETALKQMQTASTPCEQELLYPSPLSAVVRVAERLNVPSRLYIPFGAAWLPYSLSRVFEKPQVLLSLMRDIFTDSRFKMVARGPVRAEADIKAKVASQDG
jgi:proline dehydrogenase